MTLQFYFESAHLHKVNNAVLMDIGYVGKIVSLPQ